MHASRRELRAAAALQLGAGAGAAERGAGEPAEPGAGHAAGVSRPGWHPTQAYILLAGRGTACMLLLSFICSCDHLQHVPSPVQSSGVFTLLFICRAAGRLQLIFCLIKLSKRLASAAPGAAVSAWCRRGLPAFAHLEFPGLSCSRGWGKGEKVKRVNILTATTASCVFVGITAACGQHFVMPCLT